MRELLVRASLACVAAAAAVVPAVAAASTAHPPGGPVPATYQIPLSCGYKPLKDVIKTYDVKDLGHGAGPDGSTWHVRIGKAYRDGKRYVWAMLRGATAGDRVALIWFARTGAYQCGDAAGRRTAIVGVSPYSTSSVARTVGVRYRQTYLLDCIWWNLANAHKWCV